MFFSLFFGVVFAVFTALWSVCLRPGATNCLRHHRKEFKDDSGGRTVAGRGGDGDSGYRRLRARGP